MKSVQKWHEAQPRRFPIEAAAVLQEKLIMMQQQQRVSEQATDVAEAIAEMSNVRRQSAKMPHRLRKLEASAAAPHFLDDEDVMELFESSSFSSSSSSSFSSFSSSFSSFSSSFSSSSSSFSSFSASCSSSSAFVTANNQDEGSSSGSISSLNESDSVSVLPWSSIPPSRFLDSSPECAQLQLQSGAADGDDHELQQQGSSKRNITVEEAEPSFLPSSASPLSSRSASSSSSLSSKRSASTTLPKLLQPKQKKPKLVSQKQDIEQNVLAERCRNCGEPERRLPRSDPLFMWLQCDQCLGWWHAQCMDVSRERWEELDSKNCTEKWYCSTDCLLLVSSSATSFLSGSSSSSGPSDDSLASLSSSPVSSACSALPVLVSSSSPLASSESSISPECMVAEPGTQCSSSVASSNAEPMQEDSSSNSFESFSSSSAVSEAMPWQDIPTSRFTTTRPVRRSVQSEALKCFVPR